MFATHKSTLKEYVIVQLLFSNKWPGIREPLTVLVGYVIVFQGVANILWWITLGHATDVLPKL